MTQSISKLQTLEVLERAEKRITLPTHKPITPEEKINSLIEKVCQKSEDSIHGFFRLTGFTRTEFDMLLLLLDYELPPHRGKQKAIQNIDEQLFILLIFLHLGSTSMTELLTYPFYKSHSSVTQLLHSIVGNIKDTLVNLLLIFRKDRIKELQEVGLIMDCTIVPINRPSGKLADGMKFLSGKHYSYCVKVEIGVNPKNG
ncbi:uncharacterized protein MONOS_8985 [Monocercomonoides exilis]|uniref:uncharacterized protein n=1 Tax=Monocercomonoides exilis TaxID=2049356 RepID=UPI003559F7EA|nr:hypothetical protein MONOS_8985 [Monocercomonoides exilis]|eukprot:MONOS_8985.1-p1 / transcript=MONOS_8985.1 / gene=MONOS_8985 / organism=Monocercomonoides_exilis_PA203 / gene_product=unspecified product / transcript_product=unspecified product / location=Mono_scaffold00355:28648-29342(+) / protein_length=200 / sequence_SO=supercontig / SO=protein_coding / is_pseudo=false